MYDDVPAMDAVEEIEHGPQHSTEQPPRRSARKRIVPWLILAAICVIYVAAVESLHPTNLFGMTEDDSIYFTSAKALAEGRGYILPSIPGTPPATKYPILYPWLLSWIWRWNPSFPDNLNAATTLTLIFGCAYLLCAFLFFRSLRFLEDGSALLLTFLCAIVPSTIFWSSSLMSDVPFAALALAACVLAARAIAKPFWSSAIASGVAAGAAIAIRVLGFPVAVGLYVAMGLRSGWRKSAIFLVPVLPAVILAFWPSLVATPSVIPAAPSACAHAWKMTWLYYTSYLGFWKADVLSNHILGETFFGNLFSLPLQPGSYFVEPRFVWPTALGWVLLILLAGLSIAGIIRELRQHGWRPIHLALLLYLGPLLIWDFAFANRFLLPFLPLFVGGLWIETTHLVARVRKSSDGKRRVATAALFYTTAAIVFVTSLMSSWGDLHSLSLRVERRVFLINDKREAYNWLRQHTPPDSRVIAFEHASVYLYSGRQAIRPTTIWPSPPPSESLNAELSCITSSAEPIGARYWLVADDDFDLSWPSMRSSAITKEREVEATLPLLFQSQKRLVRIYGISVEKTLAANH